MHHLIDKPHAAEHELLKGCLTWYGTGFQKGIIKSTIQYPILRSRDNKTFSCPTELSIKLIMLTNIKLPTIVDILTFISWLEQHLRA